MDEPTLEIVRDWLSRADHDLQAARRLSPPSDPLLDAAIYHCQQAAEKAVKAWLQFKSVTIPRIHDIEELIELAAVSEPKFLEHRQIAQNLTPYVSAFRYPGGFDEPLPTQEEFDVALKNAETIYHFVLNLLPKEARP